MLFKALSVAVLGCLLLGTVVKHLPWVAEKYGEIDSKCELLAFTICVPVPQYERFAKELDCFHASNDCLTAAKPQS